jgi:hypothetical protein
MTDIPDGYGIIAGRSRANAQAALDAAAEAGVDPAEVKAVKEGYLVPEAVLDAFHGKSTGDEPADEPEPTPTSDWKNADIKDWAAAHDVDLGEATTKADMLDVIASTNKEE